MTNPLVIAGAGAALGALGGQMNTVLNWALHRGEARAQVEGTHATVEKTEAERDQISIQTLMEQVRFFRQSSTETIAELKTVRAEMGQIRKENSDLRAEIRGLREEIQTLHDENVGLKHLADQQSVVQAQQTSATATMVTAAAQAVTAAAAISAPPTPAATPAAPVTEGDA